MRKLIFFFTFGFLLIFHSNAQSIVGQWTVTNVKGSPGAGIDFSDKALEKMLRAELKTQSWIDKLTETLLQAQAKKSTTPLTSEDTIRIKKAAFDFANNPDSSMIKEQMKETRRSIKETFKKMYFQFNPDGTYALGGVDEEDPTTGTYTLNKKIKKIALSGGAEDTYFYDFRGKTLHLLLSTGEGEFFLERAK